MKQKPMRTWIGNYDGRREGLVLAPTKTAAARIVGCTLRRFNDFWTEPQRIIQTNGVAEFEPETLYTRPYKNHDATFVKGRCPL